MAPCDLFELTRFTMDCTVSASSYVNPFEITRVDATNQFCWVNPGQEVKEEKNIVVHYFNWHEPIEYGPYKKMQLPVRIGLIPQPRAPPKI